jgi:hypothetical protein
MQKTAYFSDLLNCNYAPGSTGFLFFRLRNISFIS